MPHLPPYGSLSSPPVSDPSPDDSTNVHEQFLSLMQKRGWNNLPDQAKQRMLSYSVKKKWSLICQTQPSHLPQRSMESLTMNEPPSRPSPTLPTLPTELQLEIISRLSVLSLLCLRGTNRHFHSLIPSPTRQDLLDAEDTSEATTLRLLYCNPCHRLRHQNRFGEGKMRDRSNSKNNVAGRKKFSRFCADCGSRPLTGTKEDAFKYSKGNIWRCKVKGEDKETTFVRCNKCGGCKVAAENKKVKLCRECAAGVKMEKSQGGGKKERGIGEKRRSNRGPSKSAKKEGEESE